MQTHIKSDFGAKLRGVIRLTRWKEYVIFVSAVTLFGGLLALGATAARPDWHLAVGAVANILVVAYAFMINDIEDAPDDAREAHRAARNPVACGELSPREGWIASGLVALVTLIAYAALGIWPLMIGAFTLLVSHLYSWKPVRLKAWPVVDVLSHALMLSGLLFLVGYFTYHSEPGPVWLVALAVTLVSCYGQLYNQIRDYEMDKAAKLRNTAILIGRENTQRLMYLMLGLAGVSLVVALAQGIIPLWVAPVPFLWAIPVFFVFRSGKDNRGTAAVDLTGNLQGQVMLIALLTTLVWLVVALVR